MGDQEVTDLVTVTVSTIYDPLHFHTRNGSKDDNAVISEIFTENVYRTRDAQLEEGDIVLDVGANIGAFTLDMLLKAKQKGVSITIYAFEPEPNNRDLLKKNLVQNAWVFGNSEVIVITDALSDKNGGTFITNKHGSSRLATEGTPVKTITLDHFFEQEGISKVRVAKFDIEGSEIPVLMSCSNATLDKIWYTAIEFDEESTLEDFTGIINRFARKCSFNTLGVPSRGCYIYAERHID